MIGMNYKILPTKEFSKDFKKLDKYLKDKIKVKINEVAVDPTRYKKLHYALKGSSRIRIEKIRIIFSFEDIKKELYLEKIVFGHKY
jgi:mRNA-degrading endonuclease RelE of RelBE toxin-antitoxin system